MIYLDCAATSLQKPPSVEAAVLAAMKSCASPGRGSHTASMNAADVVYDCRTAAAELFGVDSPEKVIFTMNATHALNIALNSLVKRGDTVVISGYEHNAVTRPLHAVGARVKTARSPLFDADAAVEAFARLLPGAQCAVCNYVSNVFGFILPIERIARLCRDYGVPLVVDASQAAGTLPIDCTALGAAFVAMPGHKGLLGPQGTGLLLCREGGEPLLFGGTGSNSALQDMPDFTPDRLEAGTHNVPGIAGLLAGLEEVRRRGLRDILTHERNLMRLLSDRLEGLSGVEVFRSRRPEMQTGVLSVRTENSTCDDLAEALNAHGVAVRPGLHCAPCAHETAGTMETGTVRFSFSPFNTAGETLRAAELAVQIIKKM